MIRVGLLIMIAILISGGVWYWFTLIAQPTEEQRYASQPTGWNSPAGKCVVCHSLEKGGASRVAPTLWGIIGAPKAGTKGYGYSLALTKASGVWTERELEQYLTAPSQFLPGTTKTITGLPDAQDRAKVIAYLATLKN
jgi:cytochrome c2